MCQSMRYLLYLFSRLISCGTEYTLRNGQKCLKKSEEQSSVGEVAEVIGPKWAAEWSLQSVG